MEKRKNKKTGRPLMYESEGRLLLKAARLNLDTVRRLTDLGHGNLSAGIRKAAASRSTKRYRLMVEAAQEVVDAYDMNEDMGPAIDGLLDAIRTGCRC